MRRKRYTTVFLTLLAVLLILAVASVLYARYRELTDFSNRLSTLVAAKTEGHYRLRIEKEEKDFFKLRVTFRNIYLERAGGDSTNNHIESVFIPRIAVNIGSLQSWLMDRQIDVKTFVVDEPVVNVRTTGKRNHNASITRNLLDIYPAVEEVLNNFIIHSFTVQRGNLKIDNSSKEVINLRLIDFLVQEWNMRDLDGNSHLALHIGKQDLPIDKSTLSFSAIEFQYPQHYLLFKDLSFTSRDTLSQSQLSVKNANILIEGLDYDELYHHERYKLKKIEVQHPQISGTLHLARGRKGKSRDLLSNLMRQTFGEASLDSAILKKANIDLTFANGKDSINTQLPEVDISLVNFAIPKEKALRIEGVHINLNATAIRLNDDVVLHCDGLGFGRNSHLDIENARLARATGGAPFIQCKRIHLKSFQLLDFIFDKQLRADSVLLEDADVSLSRADLSLLPHASADSAQQKKVLLNLGVLALRNVNFHYHDSTQSVTARGVQARFYAIHELSLHGIMRRLSGAEAQTIAFENRSRMFKGSAGKVAYKARGFRIAQLNVSARTVSVQARNIQATPVFTTATDIDPWHWQEIAAGQLSLSGTLPAPEKHTGNDEKDHTLRLDALAITNMSADIRTGNTKVSFTGKGIRGRALSNQPKTIPDLAGTLYNLDLVTPKTQLQADSFALAFNRRSTGYQVRVTRSDIKLLMPYAAIGRVTQDAQNTRIAYIRARRLEARKTTDETLVSADSVTLRSILLAEGKKPAMDELVAYGLVVPENTSRKNKTQDFEWPEAIGKINLYNGKLFLRDQKTFRFNHIESSRNHSIALDSGWYSTSNNSVRLGGVNVNNDALSIGLLQIKPTAAYIRSMQTENDIMEGTLRNVTFTEFEADSLLNGGPLIADEMKLGDIQLSVRRDKRMPDGAPAEKPFFLHELLPERLHLHKLTVAGGTITYSETSEKTGKTGDIILQDLHATVTGTGGRELSQGVDLDAKASLYGQVPFAVQYRVLGPDHFQLKLTVDPCDLTALNKVMVPLQSIEIKSGRLQSFSVDVLGGRTAADGFATMSYRDLHLEIQKTGEQGKKNLGKNLSNTFLTFVADGLILRNNKTRARAALHQVRIAEKSVFNYWIKIATHGALNVLRHGKQEKQETLEDTASK